MRDQASAPGGGMDIPIVPHLAWRLQADRLDAAAQTTANQLGEKVCITA